MICKGRNAFHCLRAGAATMAILAAVALSPTVRAAEQGNWVPTWAASPQPVWEPDFFGGVGIPRSVRDQTVRQIGRVSIGGDRVRFIVSNEYGKEPLTIGSAHVALAGEGSATVPGSDHKVTFGGKDSITIPPGAPAMSDPVDLKVPPLSSVAVSLYFPNISPTTTWHNDAKQTGYLADGNVVDAAELKDAKPLPSRVFLDENSRRRGTGGARGRHLRRFRLPTATARPRI